MMDQFEFEEYMNSVSDKIKSAILVQYLPVFEKYFEALEVIADAILSGDPDVLKDVNDIIESTQLNDLSEESWEEIHEEEKLKK